MSKRQRKRKNKSPKIYRFIPDSVKASAGKPSSIWKHFFNLNIDLNRKEVFNVYRKALRIFTLFIFIVAIVALGFDLSKNIKEKEKTDFERERITRELNFWQSFVAKHHDYRDAYLQLAVLEYRLRDVNKAKFYLNKSLSIDPNFEKARELEKILSIK